MSIEYEQDFEKSEEELWEQFTKTEGIDRADICIALGTFAYKKGNHIHSLTLCETARDLYESEGEGVNPRDLVQAYLGMAYSLEGLNRLRGAAEAAHQAVTHLPDTDLSETAELLRYESRIWYQAENYERSIKCSESALRQPDPETNNHKIGIDYFNIGMGHQMLEHWLKAIKNYCQARSYFQKDRDPTCVAGCDEELTKCFIHRKNGINAEFHAQLALDYANTTLDNNRQRYSNYYLGLAKKINGDLKGAEKYLQDAQYLITVGGDRDWQLLIKVGKALSEIMHLTDRSDEGEEILRRLKGIEDTLGGGEGDE